MVKRILGAAVILVLLLAAFASGWVMGRTGIGSVVDPESLTDVEREFADRMRGAALVGSFTVAGRDRGASADRYDIERVEKVGDNLWQFNASMSCCGLDGTTIPIAVPMRFVGDTAMIEMTDTSLPGIGTFTVRLLFYGDRYAGTWQHGQVGGLMYGRIEKQGASAPAPEP